MEWKADWGLRFRMFLTMFLLFGVYIVFLGILFYSFQLNILTIALIFGGFSLIQYYFSDTLALRSMGAKKVTENEHPELHAVIGRLSQQADLPKPTVAVANSQVPNAFAAGRSKNTAAVCVTTGLLNQLEPAELEGVLAHELAHIKNRDVTVMTIASFLSTIAFIIVRWGWLFGNRGRNQAPIWVAILVSLVVWIISFFLIRALSRYREFAADRGAATITGRPSALASALMKISGNIDRIPERDLRDQAEMNAFFIIPVKKGFIGRLFSTHPDTERRIERLQALEREIETV